MRSLPCQARTWTIDVVGPFPPGGGAVPGDGGGQREDITHVLVAVEDFTRWVELVPMTSHPTGPMIVRALSDAIIHRHGVPSRIRLDNAPYFACEAVVDAADAWGVQLVFGTPYSSRSQARAERHIGMVTDRLRLACEGGFQGWGCRLQSLAWILNTEVRKPTGHSPFTLLYACSPVTSLHLLTGGEVASMGEDQEARRLRVEDLWMEAASVPAGQEERPGSWDSLAVGDTVMLHIPRPDHRLDVQGRAPFKIVAKAGEETYRIQHWDGGPELTRHRRHLRPFRADRLTPTVRSRLVRPGHHFVPDQIVGESADGLEVRVRWEGYGPEEDTWEPRSSLQGMSVLTRWEEGR